MRGSLERQRLGRIGVAALAACAIAMAAGCGSDGGSDGGSTNAAASGKQSVDLMLPFPLNVNYVAGTMAADRFFGEEGLDVEFQAVDGSPIVVQQIVAGKADIVIGDRGVAARSTRLR